MKTFVVRERNNRKRKSGGQEKKGGREKREQEDLRQIKRGKSE